MSKSKQLIQRADAARAKLAELGVTEQDVTDAVKLGAPSGAQEVDCDRQMNRPLPVVPIRI